jgi:hypothetical protein
MKCPSCGAANTDEFQHCRSCGTYISPLYQDQRGEGAAQEFVGPKWGNETVEPEMIMSSLKTWEPVIGGTIVFLVSLLAIIVSLLIYPRTPADYEQYSLLPSSYVTTVFKAVLIVSPIGLVGGLLSIARKNYTFANAGCAAAILPGIFLFYLYGLVAVMIAWGFIATSEGEFKSTPDEEETVPPKDFPNIDQ